MDKKDFLAEAIASDLALGRFPPGRPMPTVGAISQRYGLARGTVLAALALLGKKKLIGRPDGRRRYFPIIKGLAPDTSFPSALPASDTRVQIVARSLREDLQSGALAGLSRLPTGKALARRYRCHGRTLAAALEELVRDGVLEAAGRGYSPRFAKRPMRAGTSLYLVGRKGLLLPQYHGHLVFVRALEREMDHLEWRVLKVLFADDPSAATIPPDHRIGGFVHLLYQTKRPWFNFLEARPDIPVALVDFGERLLPGAFRHRDSLLLGADNRRAGREVGLYLRSLGHRHVAFLSHVPLVAGEARWALLRVEGLSEVFPRVTRGRASLSVFQNAPLAPGAAGSAVPRLSQVEKELIRVGNQNPILIRQAFAPAYDALNRAQLGRTMAPVFARALAQPAVTAWICVNDDLASLALSFLTENGKQTPKDMALVGFDNLPTSYLLDVTSYDFCHDRLAQLAVKWLADRSAVPASERRGCKLAGKLIRRNSTEGV